MLLVWNEEEKINVKEFDDQHHEIFDLCNNLNDAIEQNKSRDFLQLIIDELSASAVKHFNCEESYMKKHKYFGYYSHKLEHDRFLRKVKEYTKDFESGADLVDFTVFLKNWLKNHLELKDKDLAKFLNEIGIS